MNTDENRARADRCLAMAEVFMLEAECCEPESRKSILLEAKDVLIRAETLVAGCGALHLARISARARDFAMCKRWLERARDRGALSDRKALDDAHEFAELRSEAWFNAIEKSLNPRRP